MAARESYTLQFKCPSCGATGQAECSVADAILGSPDFRVERLTPGFDYSTQSEFPQHAKISCAKCDVEIG